MLSTEENVFPNTNEIVTSTSPYLPGAILEEGEWFSITGFSQQDYSLDLLSEDHETVDFDSLSREDFKKVDFIFVMDGDKFCFQNISKAKLATKRCIGSFGEGFRYRSDCEEIVIKDLPDAIYSVEYDTLYFHKLEAITNIFKGIDQLYREATEEETAQFLENDFVCLTNEYSDVDVKKANRKRIALANETLNQLSVEDRSDIFSYIGEYCPELQTNEGAFEVGTEDELKMLLFGIEQRFYTTPVGAERRIANSVIPFEQGGTR
jgi:hypothetical protein